MKYERHSPSSLNLFCASPSMFVLEKIMGLRQPVGAPAHRGTAVEDGITFGLLNPDAELGDCVDVALKKYDIIAALSVDERRENYRATIAGMVKTGLAELRPYGIPSECQGLSSGGRKGCVIPSSATGTITGLITTSRSI